MLFEGSIFYDKKTKSWGASVPSLEVDIWGGTKQETFLALSEGIADLAEFPEMEIEIRNYKEKEQSFDLHIADSKETIAFVFRRMRAKEGLTLRQIGELTGHSFTSYAAYERGEKTPSLLKFAALAATANMELKLVPGKVKLNQTEPKL